MDSLLEKLRAAAPQTRDTRDRRRRARLNDRHQKRVMSGQKLPEIEGVPDPTDDGPPISPPRPGSSNPSLTASEPADMGAISEGEDVADRAASLMQSLRADGPDAEPPMRDDTLRVRRRRESADDERARRRRRRAGQTSTSEAANPTISIPEEPANGEGDSDNRPKTGMSDDSESVVSSKRIASLETPLGSPPLPSPPITIVSPPSPTLSERDDGSQKDVYATPMETPSEEKY